MIANGACATVCAAGLLWLAVVEAEEGTGGAAQQTTAKPYFSLYPPEYLGSEAPDFEPWAVDACFVESKKSPVAEVIVMPADADDAGIEVTVSTKYEDSFKWICSSTYEDDCSLGRTSNTYCLRSTATVTSGDREKSHKVTRDMKEYYYEGSELHVPAEHQWGEGPENAYAELQVQFTTDGNETDAVCSVDAKRLAFVVGFKNATNGGQENKFLKALMAETDTDSYTAKTVGVNPYTAKTVSVKTTEVDKKDPLFNDLDVGEFLNHFIDQGKGVLYEGTETHPPCRDQTMVVSDKLMEISAAQVDMLRKYIGMTYSTSYDTLGGNSRNPDLNQDNYSRLLAAGASTGPVLKMVSVTKATTKDRLRSLASQPTRTT